MFNLGLADDNQKTIIESYCNNATSAIQAGDYTGAFEHWDQMLVGQAQWKPTQEDEEEVDDDDDEDDDDDDDDDDDAEEGRKKKEKAGKAT